MGLRLFGGSSSPDRLISGTPEPGDPNPRRFEILNIEQVGVYCVAEIRYPDAASYGGRKLAVYKANEARLRSASVLDPHFSDLTGPLVPIARFPPTAVGWAMARSSIR